MTKSTIRQRIMRELERRGPMTNRALSRALQAGIDTIRHEIKGLIRERKVHVSGWVFESDSGRGPPSALIKAGDDISEPMPPSSEIPRVTGERPDFYGVNSVFALGSKRKRVDVVRLVEKNLPGPKHSVDGQTIGSYTGRSSKGSRKAER